MKLTTQIQEYTDPTFEIDQSNNNPFPNSNIPVVDISKYGNASTKKEFLESLEKGLKFGFFTVVNPGYDNQAIKEGICCVW